MARMTHGKLWGRGSILFIYFSSLCVGKTIRRTWEQSNINDINLRQNEKQTFRKHFFRLAIFHHWNVWGASQAKRRFVGELFICAPNQAAAERVAGSLHLFDMVLLHTDPLGDTIISIHLCSTPGGVCACHRHCAGVVGCQRSW